MLPDRDERRRALTDFGRNLVVTAGAGTGKTSLLVGRLLAALLCQHMDPGRLLAVTFTENAAAEMRQRLARMLRAVPAFLDGAPIDGSDRFVLEELGIGPEHRARAADRLADLDRLALATFHGFCLRLLQEQARDLDLPATLRIGTEETVRERFDQDFLAFLGTAAQGPHAEVLDSFEAQELRELAFALLTLPEESWDTLATPFVPTDLETRAAELDALLARFPGARPAWRDYAGRLRDHYGVLRTNRGAVDLELLVKTVPKAGKRELGERDDLLATEALGQHRDYLRALLDTSEPTILRAREFLLPFLHDQRANRARAGELSFDDLLLLTRRVLMDRGAVRKQLAGRYQSILVDEFQDTDPLQYDVLFLLASDPTRDAGDKLTDPTRLPLRPCLFIVGDAKQSVYRFRRADVGAYFRAVAHIAGDASASGRLTLSANFRSRPRILGFVNAACAHMLAPDVPYQLGYEPVHAVRDEKGEGARVELLLLPRVAGTQLAYARRVREGQAIIDILDELRHDGVALGSIAILLRAATDTAWLLRPLRQAGVPYVMQGSRRFYSRHEIVLAGALLAAMARPFDPVPTLAILRSAVCGAVDAELVAWRNAGRAFDYREDVVGEGPVADGLRLLRDLHARVTTLPLHAALPAILRHEDLLLTEGAGFEGAQRLANLERLLLNLLAAAPLDLAAAAALVERRALRETDDEESALFEEGGEAVRIMTVHAAKGLEFDVVILPDIARRPPSDPDGERWAAERQFTADGRELVAVQVGAKVNRAARVARIEARRHDDAEERRLFYVASTRARERLLLLGHDDDDVVRQSRWQADLVTAPLGGIAGFALRQLDEPRLRPVAPSDAEAFDVAPAVHALDAHRALAVRAAQEARPAARTASGEGPDQDQPAVPGPARSLALRLGEAAHAYLALVDFAASEVDRDLLRRVAPEPDICAPLEDWLARFHTSPLRARLAAARSVERELPVAYRTPDGRTVHGVLDVLTQAADGAWHILDWKTDRSPDHERHRAQLDAYAHGVQLALDLPDPPGAQAVFLQDST